MLMQPSSLPKWAIPSAVLVVLVLLVAGVMTLTTAQSPASVAEVVSTPAETEAARLTATSTTSDPNTVTTSPATESTASPTPASATTYKNGTYSITASYSTPDGLASMGVSLTIADDIITAATVTSGASDRDSKEYQADFIAGYKTAVVGKSLESLQLSRISGASLTTRGFNTALGTIRAQAKA